MVRKALEGAPGSCASGARRPSHRRRESYPNLEFTVNTPPAPGRAAKPEAGSIESRFDWPAWTFIETITLGPEADPLDVGDDGERGSA